MLQWNVSNTQREALRQQALMEIALLDTTPEREFDALAKLAQRMLGTGMSSITLIDPQRQWFKARCVPLRPGSKCVSSLGIGQRPSRASCKVQAENRSQI